MLYQVLTSTLASDVGSLVRGRGGEEVSRVKRYLENKSVLVFLSKMDTYTNILILRCFLLYIKENTASVHDHVPTYGFI